MTLDDFYDQVEAAFKEASISVMDSLSSVPQGDLLTFKERVLTIVNDAHEAAYEEGHKDGAGETWAEVKADLEGVDLRGFGYAD